MNSPIELIALERAPASDIKTKGWPGVMRLVRANGALVVTNHNHPEAVIVDADHYLRLVSEAKAASVATSRAQSLSALQSRFDEHLTALKTGSLAKALSRPARRGAKVTLGKPL